MVEFRIENTDGKARAGVLRCGERIVRTPAFFPVATAGAVKGITPEVLRRCGVSGILVNAYHLARRPGLDVIKQAGGIHRFSGWDGFIITDSGGYQVMSLGENVKVYDEGVYFRSPFDGSEEFVTPKDSIMWQETIGADVIMAFDECVGYPVDEERARRAVERTIRWAEECKKAHKSEQALFGITQGSVFENLRRRCAESLVGIGFDGYAIGGVSVGEPVTESHRIVHYDCGVLPENKPRYLMGVGSLREILEAVSAGVDIFDSVLPTRNGRTGQIFTLEGRLRILAKEFRFDNNPPERGCDCYLCVNFTRAYLRHLFVSGDILGPVLATLHNIRFLERFIEKIREAIAEKRLSSLRQIYLSQ
jgi:queuine tRNA-ribosyltransferase